MTEIIGCFPEVEGRQEVLEKIMAMHSQIPLYSYENYLVVDDTFDSKYRQSPVAVCDVSYPFHRSSDSLFVDRDWRKRICEWMYKIVDFYSFERDVVAFALSYLDRFLSKMCSKCTLEQCQLVALTALYLAVKLHEPMSPIKSSHLFIRFSDGHFTESDLITMETKIVRTLDWMLFPPTPQAFASFFIQLLPEHVSAHYSHKLLEISTYIIEMVVFDLDLFSENPARLACASIVLATEGAHPHILSASDKCVLLSKLAQRDIVDLSTVAHLRDKMKVALEQSLGSMLVLQESIDPEGVIYPYKRHTMKRPCRDPVNIIPLR